MLVLKAADLGMLKTLSPRGFNLISMIFSFSGLQSENTSLKVENVDLTGGYNKYSHIITPFMVNSFDLHYNVC